MTNESKRKAGVVEEGKGELLGVAADASHPLADGGGRFAEVKFGNGCGRGACEARLRGRRTTAGHGTEIRPLSRMRPGLVPRGQSERSPFLIRAGLAALE